MKKISKRLDDFSVWKAKSIQSLKIPCRNRYGDVAHFEDYKGVVMIGFGEEDGFEPDKDALAFDKEDLPEVIKFLQSCLEK